MPLRLALFEPDIPQNTGTLMRLAACMNIALDIIEPCGFLLTDKNLRRAGMDYIDQLDWQRHNSWQAFHAACPGRRLVLLTTKTTHRFTDFTFDENDTLLLGRESAGVPQEVHDACPARVTVPMRAEMRSLNVAIAAAMVLTEALRQTALFPS